MTTTFESPTAAFFTRTTVGSDLNAREASLYGTVMRTTSCVPGRWRMSSTSSEPRSPTAPSTMRPRSSERWTERPMRRSRAATSSICASSTPGTMTTTTSAPGGLPRPRSVAWRARSDERALAQERVGQGEREHRLGDRHDARADARVVASLDLDHDRLAGLVHGVLRLGDRRRGLHGDTGDDVLPGRDPAEDAAGVVRLEAVGADRVVALRATEPGRGKARAD